MYVNGDKQILNNEKVELKNVHSLLLSSPNNQAMNIGYIFLDKTSLDFLNKTNQGRWKDINASQSDQLHENNFLTFYKTHSKEDTRYAYVMYPNVSNDELAKKEESNKVKILQNNASVQAVYDADEESWGVVLYEDMPLRLMEL